MNTNDIEPSEQAIQTAKKSPNGWVYQISGGCRAGEAVPPEKILGAWKVDSNGNIVGNFMPNPNYKAEEQADSKNSAD